MSGPAPDTIFGALAQAADRHGDREYLVIGRRAGVASFRGLAAGAARFGAMLERLGVRARDRVALWMTNGIPWATAAFGIARCRAVTVAVNTRLSPREVAHMLALTRPRVWLLEEEFLGKIDAAAMVAPVLDMMRAEGAPLPVVVVRSPSGRRHAGCADWDALLEGATPPIAAPRDEADPPELDGVCAILSTSGTTAAPKGVMLRHDGLLRLAAACAERQGLAPGVKFYTIGPFFHCSGFMHGLLANLVAGSTMFTSPRYQAEEAWDVILGEGIETYHGFIGVMQDMAERMAAHGRALPLDRAWYSAPAAEMARLETILGTKQCEVYGLTETGGNVAICTADDPVDMRHDSDGRPHDGLQVKIVAPDGAILPEGAPGEILVRGWNLMQGYFRDPAATAKAVDAEGWLHTGDQGVALPGGYVKFLSRLKDVIRVGGENLSPLEVEEVLVAHPGVVEVAVVAAPHPRLAEVPVAFLIARREVPVSAEALDAWCRARLANFKVPARFIFVDDLPRTGATARVQKARLRELLERADV